MCIKKYHYTYFCLILQLIRAPFKSKLVYFHLREYLNWSQSNWENKNPKIPLNTIKTRKNIAYNETVCMKRCVMKKMWTGNGMRVHYNNIQKETLDSQVDFCGEASMNFGYLSWPLECGVAWHVAFCAHIALADYEKNELVTISYHFCSGKKIPQNEWMSYTLNLHKTQYHIATCIFGENMEMGK